MLLLLAACSTQKISSYDLTAKVTRVVDGDTLEIELNGKKEKVRLLLIDTPETHNEAKAAGYRPSKY